jgi:hypothetical protein
MLIYLILWTLFDHDAPLTWSFGGHFHDDAQDVVHYTEDVGPLMQSIGSFDDLAYPLDTFPHLLDLGHWTYELGCCRYGLMGYSRGRKPLTMDIVPFEDLSLGLMT